MPRPLKIVLGVVVAYVLLVFAFESFIGVMQPEAGEVLTITTVGDDGFAHDRVVAKLESGGKLYVAANHWPRRWYRQALENPDVKVTIDGVTGDYVAVPATPEEHARVHAENDPGIAFRILTGFPPRYFLRLDPRPGA